jgi:ComF family protein
MCLRDPPAFERCHGAVDYGFPWDRLVARFKFAGDVALAAPLAHQLCLALEAEAGERPALLVPVPLGPRRLRERGYNQAWELARQLSRRLRVPASPTVLQRFADGEQQAALSLPRRRDNLRGAFIVSATERGAVRHGHVALVDDVMTSGATLREAAATLLHAGARRVDAWVFARTPPPGD